MKSIITTTIFSLFTLLASSQFSAEVQYDQIIKFEFDIEETGGVDLSGMLPESQTFKKTLLIDGDESVFIDVPSDQDDEQSFETEDGSFQIVLMSDDTEDILYTSLSHNQTVHQQGFLGKTFVVSQEIENPGWKISDEKIKYLGYECIKATRTNSEDEEIIAWFTPELPCQLGPGYNTQLPGLILMVSIDEGSIELKATEVKVGEVDTKLIKTPTSGKKVTSDRFQKIQDEKMKELEKMNDGENSITIRG